MKEKHKLICKKCGNEFEIECTNNEWIKHKHKLYCSRSCANSHKLTDEQKKHISNGIKSSIKFQTGIERRYQNNKKKCPYCNEEYEENGLNYHIIYCSKNPNGKTKMDLNRKYIMKDGTKLDKTYFEINEYLKTHKTCEICGKTVEESIRNKQNKFKPKRLCIDHDHNTNKFRGILCSRCNRELGWYELYKDKISNYLNK